MRLGGGGRVCCMYVITYHPSSSPSVTSCSIACNDECVSSVAEVLFFRSSPTFHRALTPKVSRPRHFIRTDRLSWHTPSSRICRLHAIVRRPSSHVYLYTYPAPPLRQNRFAATVAVSTVLDSYACVCVCGYVYIHSGAYTDCIGGMRRRRRFTGCVCVCVCL